MSDGASSPSSGSAPPSREAACDPTAVIALASGSSLAICGVGSILLGLWSGSISGGLVGLALFAHGAAELRSRAGFLRNRHPRWIRGLRWNQGLLALSLSLYLGYQMATLDAEALRAALRQDLVKAILSLYPPELVAELNRQAPNYARVVYGLMVLSAWAGCVGLSGLYARWGRRRGSAV